MQAGSNGERVRNFINRVNLVNAYKEVIAITGIRTKYVPGEALRRVTNPNRTKLYSEGKS